MGKPPGASTGLTATASGSKRKEKGATAKRPNPAPAAEQSASKKLLANNRFAVLDNGADQQPVPKGKIPAFFIKGRPANLKGKLVALAELGLKFTIKLCTEGYKVMVTSIDDYKVVEGLLIEMELEYFSHDIDAEKPFKVVLRGLPDMEVDSLKSELKDKGLKPINIYKMRRHDASRTYRDQLYLVHLENKSTCLKDLRSIKAIDHIVVEWEAYKPVHRSVTQCANCLKFGHGSKNCHMAKRCIKCGKSHADNACELMEAADPVCINCSAAHKATSKACPKRAEFIANRKRTSTKNQPGRRKVPEQNAKEFPTLVGRNPITLLAPLPLNNRKPTPPAASSSSEARRLPTHKPAEATASTSYSPPPGFQGGSTGMTYTQAEADEANIEPMLTMEEYLSLVVECITTFRTCKTRAEQLQCAVMIASKYGP